MTGESVCSKRRCMFLIAKNAYLEREHMFSFYSIIWRISRRASHHVSRFGGWPNHAYVTWLVARLHTADVLFRIWRPSEDTPPCMLPYIPWHTSGSLPTVRCQYMIGFRPSSSARRPLTLHHSGSVGDAPCLGGARVCSCLFYLLQKPKRC